MVLGIGTDGTRLVVLLQSTQDVLEAFATRYSPVADSFFITHIGRPSALQFFGDVWGIDGRIIGQVGELESSRTVGDESIGHQDDGRHVFQGHLAGGVCSLEAVGRTGSSNHRHRTLAITAEESLQEIGLFTLCRQTSSRTAALHIEYHERQLHDNRQVHCLALEADTGTGSTRHSQSSCERSTYGTRTTGYLILTLHGNHA